MPFSWDNWRYLATTYSILDGNFENIALSGLPFKSFYSFPIGLSLIITPFSYITPSLYDAGKLTVLILNLWLVWISYLLHFKNKIITSINISIWLLLVLC